MKQVIRIVAFILLLCMFGCACAEGVAISEYETINGKNYKKRQNILTYLLMGIDDKGPVHERNMADDEDIPGQCDVLILLVIDKAADTYAMIPIDRNTVTGVHAISDYDGSDLGVFDMQIALAHTNGNGLAQSCEVTAQAVSDLLMGIRVDHYMAMNMDAIAIINNSVGGVTVTIEDDFSAVDPSLVIGETVKLTDAQAVEFVQNRQQVGDGTNACRMKRQQKFVEAFKPMAIEKYRANAKFPLDLVHSMADYMVTDMSDKDFSYIAKAVSQNKDLGIFHIDGETTIDRNEWEAFTPNKDSIENIVLQLFYKDAGENK